MAVNAISKLFFILICKCEREEKQMLSVRLFIPSRQKVFKWEQFKKFAYSELRYEHCNTYKKKNTIYHIL